MTFLASYLFPHGERVIDEFIPTGFSLGGAYIFPLVSDTLLPCVKRLDRENRPPSMTPKSRLAGAHKLRLLACYPRHRLALPSW